MISSPQLGDQLTIEVLSASRPSRAAEGLTGRRCRTPKSHYESSTVAEFARVLVRRREIARPLCRRRPVKPAIKGPGRLLCHDGAGIVARLLSPPIPQP